MEELEQLEEIRPEEAVLPEETIPEQEPLPPQPPVKELRREANTQGAALLIYHLILNVAVMAVMLLSAFAVAFSMVMQGAFDTEADLDTVIAQLMDQVMGASGWGYLLAGGIGLVVLLLWKKGSYFRDVLLQKNKPMGPGSFFALLSLAMSAQMIAQVGNLGLLALLELLGMDPSVLQQLASADTDSLSMFLYIGIAAPITEELLFRGLLLRGIAPYNKKLAVFGSAILFGLYHANPIQIPYAILVGLVLAYVTLEYNIYWAIALHMFNNLVFALLLPMVLSPLPVGIQDLIMWAVIIGFFVAAVVIVIIKRSRIADHWKQEQVEPWQRKAFWLSPTIVIMIILCVVNTVATMAMLFIQ